MATLKQATTPPSNLKDMQQVSSPAPTPSGVPPVALTGLGSTAIGPIPAFLGTTFDTIRQWIRPSNNPQYRIFPLPAKANSQISSIVNSTVVDSSTPVSSVPFDKVTTGINTTSLMVGNGGLLEASGTGTIDATEINGIPITGTLTHPGMIPISQPGNTDAVWADPLVQGLYPPGTNVTTGGTGSTPINPVLIGAQNPSSLLENLQMDASKSLFVTGALTHNNAAPGASNIGALVAVASSGAPTYTAGDQVLLSTDLAGNLRTSGSVASTDNVTQWASTVLGAPTAYGTPPSGNVIGVNAYVTTLPAVTIAAAQTIAVTNAGTFAVQAALNAETTKVIGTVRVVGNIGGVVDAVQGATPPANAVQISAIAATALPTAATATDTVVPMADKYGRGVVLPQGPRDIIGTASVQNTGASGTLIGQIGSTYTDICNLVLTNETAAPTVVSISDGTTTYKFALAANGGGVFPFSPPLPATSTNTNWTISNSASSTIDAIVTYVKNK